VVHRDGVEQPRRGQLLAVQIQPFGKAETLYRYVVLSKNDRQEMAKVANLMLAAFVGPKPFPKAVGRHLGRRQPQRHAGQSGVGHLWPEQR
jgi:hypothetical protein